ncbi:MAG: 5-(carboxyamino)imidazole ribonucleotide mutase, partial [Mariprofundales bacterium]|nr:5-(carboxyamino)imidazole ribonucleotide mutase [Mariprofundales bacterium]
TTMKVLILMGSSSDRKVMARAEQELTDFGVDYSCKVRSAHRTPAETTATVHEAEADGCQVFICAAGMAAHLAGAVAAQTTKPVIGVPIASGALGGTDALYSTVMMPPGMPVATVAINGAKNAALLAVQILALHDEELAAQLCRARATAAEAVLAS